ncbi:MAG TPA: hypothetical protein PKI12_08535, partial [Bacteroidales bacterium]|nr:hypothetical protein [Bacteroidales bacterium]
VSVGNYSINLTGGEKGYIIAGTKALISDQEQARQKLIDQGYTIIFDRTGNAEPHNPVSTEIEEAGEIAWIAFTQEKCGLIVSVNAVNTGTTELQNEMIVNTGAHFIETGKTVRMQAVTLYCGSPVTFIIGIK